MRTLTAATAALLFGFSAPLTADTPKPPRVVVLGFDGVGTLGVRLTDRTLA